MTGLEWCHGCQTNVKPTAARECPRCGTSLPTPRTSVPSPATGRIPRPAPPKDTPVRPPKRHVRSAPEPPRNVDYGESNTVTTPAGGRLVLNPKVSGEGVKPLCPECEDPIRRVEHPNELVEFVCGCDDLRRFDFTEVGGESND